MGAVFTEEIQGPRLMEGTSSLCFKGHGEGKGENIALKPPV